MIKIKKDFFLGSNSPQGFVSRFDELEKKGEARKCYILKGGPGTGKSTLMKRIAEHFLNYSNDAEYIYCSGDKNSIDAIIFPKLKFSVVDGTAPHSLEPKYAGLNQKLILLNDAICESCLSDYEDRIIELSGKKSDCYKQMYKILLATASLLSDTEAISQKFKDKKKIDDFARGFCKRELDNKKHSKGYNYTRFLSGLTDEGYFVFEDTIKSLCDEIIFIDDEYGSVCSDLISEIQKIAISYGYDTISSPSPLFPFHKLDFLIIPEARIGLAIQNKLYDYKQLLPNRTIHSQRFLIIKEIKKYKNRIKFNNSASSQLIEKASMLLSEAQKYHAELEKIYIGATNFKKIDKITEDLILTIERDLFSQQ